MLRSTHIVSLWALWEVGVQGLFLQTGTQIEVHKGSVTLYIVYGRWCIVYGISYLRHSIQGIQDRALEAGPSGRSL